MLTAFRRKFRVIFQRTAVLTILAAIFILGYSYINLEFCYKIMAQNSLTSMCQKYKMNEYSGSLCEELCTNEDGFHDFKCPQNDMTTTIFTAVKNADIYAIKLARHIQDDLSWTNSQGKKIFPKIENFHHIVKMYITLNFNVTLDDNMIRALVNQEIDKNNPQQMFNFWRLFKDNNYMISKLYDEENLFPSILGSCGPYYATENLNILPTDQSLWQYLSLNWQKRLKYALNIMEYMYRLDEVRPDPLKMCKVKLNFFGLTADKRIKYQSAEYVKAESQLDRHLSSGQHCHEDTDCHWHACMGKCDVQKHLCTGAQQNNNMQIFCELILKGGGLYPGLLASAKTPKNLMQLVDTCIDPSQSIMYHLAERPFAPNTELTLRLYNEIKRLQKLNENLNNSN